MNNKKRIREILLFSLLTLFSVFSLYCIFGAPSLTPEMAMHRQEAQNLIGPSKVIAEGEWGFGGLDHFLLGETEYGYCLHEYCEAYLDWDDVLTYAEKTDTVTVLPVGSAMMWYGTPPNENGVFLPVFVIPESTRAVSAKLTLTAEYLGNSYEVTETTSLEQEVYFLFKVDVLQVHSHVREFWYRQLGGRPSVYPGVSGTATLELLGSLGEVTETICMDFPEMT